VTATAVATHLVEVEFKGNRRAFYSWTGEAPPPLKAAVIVTVERGEDLARIHSTGELAEKRHAGTSHGKASPNELPKVVRLATASEVDRAVRLRVDEHAVRKAAIEIARELKLDLKVSDTEWQWDRRKLTCYFTAEERVDFRELVRKLERTFSTRVHMWHIGVRDEARRLDGIGRCGRQFCSSSWLPELRPVKSSSAKDQRLSTLNPAQISGTCGRLMCCLRHEHEFYVQARKRFPKEGKIVVTTLGEEKITHNDIFRDQVTLRTPGGEERVIPLAQLRRELGEGAPAADAADADEPPSVEPEAFVSIGRAPRAEQTTAVPSAATLSPADAEHDTDAEGRDPEDGEADSAEGAPAQSESGVAGEQGAQERPRRGRRRRGRRGGRRGPGGSGDPGGQSGPSGNGGSGGTPPTPPSAT
jgi:cell fate regulator YaaT (PSP1 superfamily)